MLKEAGRFPRESQWEASGDLPVPMRRQAGEVQCQAGKVAELDLKQRQMLARMSILEKKEFSHTKTYGILGMSKAPKQHWDILCHMMNKTGKDVTNPHLP